MRHPVPWRQSYVFQLSGHFACCTVALYTSMANLVPPFTEETARAKVKAAQDIWNTKYKTLCLEHHHISPLD